MADRNSSATINRRKFTLGMGGALAGATVLAAGAFPAKSFAKGTLETAKSSGVLRLGLWQAPPISYFDTDGALTGASIEIARKVAADNGIAKVEGSVFEFDGLIPGLTSGQFDVICSSIFIKPARCEIVAFSNPDTRQGIGLVVKAGNPLKLRSFKDIAANPDAKLGGVASTYELKVALAEGVKPSQILEFPNDDANYSGIAAGRVDAITSSDILLGPMLKRKGDTSLETVADFEQAVVDGASTVNYGGFAFRKDDADLVALFNTGMRDMVASGWMAENFSKFGLSAGNIPAADVTTDKICGK